MEEIARLRAALSERDRQAAEKELEFERYATRLREAYRRERDRAREVRRSYMAAVRALTNAVEARDAYTSKHAERVAAYALQLGALIDARLAEEPEMEFGFLLHDVGKVAVPDAILHKPAALTSQERRVMRRHPKVGWEILGHIDFLGGEARRVVRFHHERWDGKGYPDRLRGDDIPLAARIFAVADALDAITTDRPYRSASPLAAARAEIRQEAGKQFDPQVVEALGDIPDDTLERIRIESSDRTRRARSARPSAVARRRPA